MFDEYCGINWYSMPPTDAKGCGSNPPFCKIKF